MFDPKSMAILMNGQPFSYEQLETRLSKLIDQLDCYQDHAVICLASDKAWLSYLFVLASSQRNQTLFLLNPKLPARRLQQLVDQSGCNFIINDSQLMLSTETTIVDVKHFFSTRQSGEISSRNICNSSGIQLIVATSGSSGEPKGVMLSTAAITASAEAVNASLNLLENDCWLNCLPLYHIAGLSIIYRCHYARASMVLHEHFHAEQVWKDLVNYCVTHISLVPVMLSRLLDVSHDASPPASLRVALIGGAALSASLARRAHNAGWPIVISYGMTETGSLCAYDDSPDAGMEGGRVGRPLNGFKISVVNGEGNISIRGPALMSGYANPGLLPGFGLIDDSFTTGDVGRFDKQGMLHVIGRSDDALVSAGRTIHPREVEEQMEKYPGIGRVAITALPDPTWGDKLVAVFEAGDFDAAGIEGWAREQLVSAIRPRIFVELDKLPVNQMGKLDRTKLRETILQLDI
jgi:O-succinylbenzoic acid--CoA ligase